jgi:hypothetical protein
MHRVGQRITEDQRPDIGELAFQGYVEGLNDAGWRGDPRVVQLGLTIATTLRYGLMWPNIALNVSQASEEQRAQMEQSYQMTTERLADIVAATIPGTLHMADQVRALIETIL